MKETRIKRLLLFVFFARLLVGCEYEKYPEPAAPHKAARVYVLKSVYTSSANIALNSSVWSTADYFVVPLTNLSIHKTDAGKGILNSTGTYNGTASFNMGDSAKLTMKSVYNNSYLYILVEWSDLSLNASGRTWLWNGPKDPNKSEDSSKWTLQKNDDRLILKYNFPDNPENQDIWMWNSALSEPFGYAIDMISKSGIVQNDEGTTMFVINGAGSNSGPLYEYSGESQIITKSNNSAGLLDPAYYLYKKSAFAGNAEAGYPVYKNTCGECHGEGNAQGYAPQLNQAWFNRMSRDAIKAIILDPDQHSDGFSHVETLTDNQLNDVFAWIRGQFGIPGFFLQTPTGSIADVWSLSNVQTGKITDVNKNGYKVLLYRKLDTGNSDDIKFSTTDGSTYTISIGLCDMDSVNYIGATNQSLVFKKTWDEK